MDEIGDAVNEVEGQSRGNPRERLLEIQVKHQRLRRCIKDAEAKPVQSAQDGIYHGSDTALHISRAEHYSAPEDCPDVEIGKPPEGKATKDAVKKNIEVEWDECLFAENDGGDGDKKSDQVNIW